MSDYTQYEWTAYYWNGSASRTSTGRVTLPVGTSDDAIRRAARTALENKGIRPEDFISFASIVPVPDASPAPETVEPSPVEHHFILTLKDSRGDVATANGTISLHPGQTRFQAYTALKDQITEEFRLETPTNVLFFDLAPNAL